MIKSITLGLALAATMHAADDRPNIVFIMADDVGRDWISCYGAKHKTPYVDKLAAEGTRYKTAWATPICTPTRVTLLTGQYPCHHGWTNHYDVPRNGGEGFSWQRFTTFAKKLQSGGYSTVIGGKWQINHLGKQKDALKQHGFDEHCVWPGVEAGNTKSEKRYWNGYLDTNGKRSTVKYGPDAINEYLVNFVKRKHKKPFLIYYPMLLPHGPHTTTPLNKEKKVAEQDLYAGHITYMDFLVGRLVSAIDKAGLRDNTLVIFCTDNGSVKPGFLDGKPYAKGKGRTADYGVHVPFIARAPFLSDKPRLCHDLIDFSDLYPTFLDLAKIKPEKSLQLDGISMVPSLKGHDDPFEKRNFIYSQLGDVQLIRDWYHIVDSKGGFHNLSKDPLQQKKVSVLDKTAPDRQRRLKMIMKRYAKKPQPPFKGYTK